MRHFINAFDDAFLQSPILIVKICFYISEPCVALECNEACEFGQVFDEKECPTCSCYRDPCQVCFLPEGRVLEQISK